MLQVVNYVIVMANTVLSIQGNVRSRDLILYDTCLHRSARYSPQLIRGRLLGLIVYHTRHLYKLYIQTTVRAPSWQYHSYLKIKILPSLTLKITAP